MSKNTVGLIIKSATTFYNELKDDTDGRYRSWEYCYKVFHDARKQSNVDLDYLSLQLAFYLASWEMYRGSSFLLHKDYKIHVPVIEELLNASDFLRYCAEMCFEQAKKLEDDESKMAICNMLIYSLTKACEEDGIGMYFDSEWLYLEVRDAISDYVEENF